MSTEHSFAGMFKNKKPKDNFLNLRRSEDISTVYHQEYVGKIEGDMDYWCEPPSGFRHDCDYILGVFGQQVGLAIGVIEKLNSYSYTLLTKTDDGFPQILSECGILPFHPYGEKEIKEIIEMIQ